MARISKTKIDALKLVEAGRIEYGAEYPNLARRSGSNALDASFLVDGSGVYGGQHSTFAALDSTGMIEVRYDLADTDDPGWRTRVELTAGRTRSPRGQWCPVVIGKAERCECE